MEAQPAADSAAAANTATEPRQAQPTSVVEQPRTEPLSNQTPQTLPIAMPEAIPPTQAAAPTAPPAASAGKGQSVPPGDAPPYTDSQLELYRCANQMADITVAIQQWAADHKGKTPYYLSELRDYIAPMTLVCPGVRPQRLATYWREFNPDEITYRVAPNAGGTDWDFGGQVGGGASKIWLLCPIHKLRSENNTGPPGIPVDQYFR